MYFQDESRFGLFTRNGRILTAKGVKPVCLFQQVFKTLYVFGAFSPLNGNSFVFEMPNCDSHNFQIFLDQFALQNPTELKIIVLDNGAFHKSKSLLIPENIKLIFLPPYSPELNPAEKMWQYMKRKFTNLLHHSLEELSLFITNTIDSLQKDQIQSICNYTYVNENDFWTI